MGVKSGGNSDEREEIYCVFVKGFESGLEFWRLLLGGKKQIRNSGKFFTSV